MISVSNLGKSYGERVLFDGASFQLNPGRRYGLVGANGSGKTTLLNVMSGQIDATDGTVSIPKDLHLGVLRQDQFTYADERILDVAMMGNGVLWEAMREKEEILARAEIEFDGDRFGELEEIVQHFDGYTAEARAAAILEGLGIPEAVHAEPLSTLSGGFRLRVLLAQVLAGNPEALMLDEPTNHLDILSIRWLEKFLRDFAGPVVVISHDHRFLDNVATDILDVDYATVTLYTGNYTSFQRQKVEERERREKDIEGREREIAHHQKFVDRFKAKASKARQAQSKVRMIEKKTDAIQSLPGSSRRYPNFRFEQRRPSGREVLTVKGVTKSYGDKQVLHGVDLTVQRGDRVAVIGPNGIGKSTLLKIAMGEVEADAGEATWGYETHPGYFAQDHKEDFDRPDRTAEEWLWDFCPAKDRGFVRGQMGLVLFSGDDGAKPLSSLSGGEAARLVFSRIMVERPNVLVLDEPTNHLDLESIEALVGALADYDGTLILVSHDRWFVGELATRIVEVSESGIRDYLGTYEEYVHYCGDDHLDADSVVLKAKSGKGGSGGPSKGGSGSGSSSARSTSGAPDAGGTPGGRGMVSAPSTGSSSTPRPKAPVNTFKLERRRDELLESIERAESRVAEIEALFCKPGYYDDTPSDEIQARETERAEEQAKADRLMVEWETTAAALEEAQGG